MKKVITISIQEDILKKLDEMVLKNKYSDSHCTNNRGDYIEDALVYFWKIKLGIPYMIERLRK